MYKGNKKNNLLTDKINLLQNILPEIFSDGKLNEHELKNLLSGYLDDSKEKYSFTWSGKNEHRKGAYTPTTLTLNPKYEESKNFESTNNVYIEGDNLSVLKILRDSYANKVKMIYIDPPYNTAKDFIYSDDFEEPFESYKKMMGILDEQGNRLTTDNDMSGRKHTNWLNLMYPRLLLARDMLKDDGVIFISIDDNEQANLKKICDEIFGEQNFEGNIHWRRRYNQPNDKTKMIGIVAEHVLAYSKDKQILKRNGVGKIDLTAVFSNPDNDPLGDWASKPWKVGSDQSGSRYTIVNPKGKEITEDWMGDKATYEKYIKENRIYFPNNGNGMPRKKYYKFEREEEGQCATNWWNHDEFGHNQGGNKQLEDLFGYKNLFSNPKPIELIRGLIQIANVKDDDIVLDFFSGSASTAHAVMELNRQDKIKRKFIMVQLPENLEESFENTKDRDAKRSINSSIKFLNDLKKPLRLSELGKERINRAGESIVSTMTEEEQKNIDIGYRVFELAETNFPEWNEQVSEETILEQLEIFGNKTPVNTTNAIFEILILLKQYTLEEKIEEIDEQGMFVIGDNVKTLVFIGSEMTDNNIKYIEDNYYNFDRVIIYDNGFKNDEQKINLKNKLKEKMEIV